MRVATAILAAGAAVMASASIAPAVSAAPAGEGPVGNCAPQGGLVAVLGPGDLAVGDAPDNEPKTVELGAFSEGCGPVDLTARVGGRTVRHRFEADANRTVNFEDFSFDPCGEGRGSDLPDAPVEVTGHAGSITLMGTLRLGPDTTAPTVRKIHSSPPPGSKVKGRDKITFSEGDVVAREDRPGATWQTGVQSLQLLAPDGRVKNGYAEATSNRPQPCDKKQWSLGIPRAQYKVPKGARGAIDICALAVDFAGNENGGTCATYYVGEVWEGTLRTDVDPCRAIGTPVTAEGSVTIVVAEDRSADGSGTIALVDVGGSPDFGCYTAVAPGTYPLSVEISGNRDRDGFHLTVFGAPLDLEIAGDAAEGTTNLGGTTVTLDVTCKSCD